MATLQNTDMRKGNVLMIFFNTSTTSTAAWKSIGFATNHTFSAQNSTSQVSTKDHGMYPATQVQQTTWSLTAENIYSDNIVQGSGATAKNPAQWYLSKMMDAEPLELYFALVGGPASAQGPAGAQSIIGLSAGSWTKGTTVVHGKALITDVSINAPNGDYATLNVTFTGVGDFTTT